MSFAQFADQQQVVRMLQRSLERGRLAHAYLFTGSDLTVLEAMAKTLAQTVNCQMPPRRAPDGMALDCCGQCDSCQRIADANHPDIQWIRPESKSRAITIDQIRDLLQTVHLKPMEGGYKVAIMVAAERLNIQAANAFLKTLEEPPPKSVFVLLSVAPQQLLETILSRCLRLNFAGEIRQQLAPDILAWLQNFSALASSPQKSLLDRYRLLGLLLKQLAQIRSAIDKHLSARSPLEKYGEADASLREKWEEELTAAIEAEYRRQRTDLLAHLQAWLRDVWMLSQSLPAEYLQIPELASASHIVAQRVSADEAVANLQTIERTQRLLETNVQEALTLEVGLLKLNF